MAIDLRSLVDNSKQRKRCLRELEYLFLAVNPHGKPLPNVAFCALPVSFDFLLNRIKPPGGTPLNTKPRTVLAVDRIDRGVVCEQTAVFSIRVDPSVLLKLRFQIFRQLIVPSQGNAKELDNG